MKLKLPLQLHFSRAYATRLPQKPPYRAPDPLVKNPNAVYQNLPEDLTFIHRPPPTAPSPLSYTTSPLSPLLQEKASPADVPLPPTMRAEAQPSHLVSDEEIAEIRRLRREDGEKWTRAALAKRFNCSQYFIMRIASMDNKARKKVLAKRDQEHEEFRSKWGEKKAFFKEAAKKRKEFW